MKVLIMGKYFYPHPGGIERYTHDLIQNISGKNSIKTLDCLVVSDTYCLETKKLSKGTLFKGGKIFTIFSTPISLYHFRHVRQHKYDIIHLHLPNPLAIMVVFFIKPNAKLILHFHAVHNKYKILDKLFTYFFMNKICEQSHAIIFTSEKIAEGSMFFKKYKNKIIINSLGIDFKYWSNESEVKEQVAMIKRKYTKKKVLFVGRLTHYKGIEYFIDSAQHVDAQFILVGSGTLASRLRRIPENVFFAGEVDTKTLKAYYYSADIVVLPSTSPSEAFGIVQLEAMACGKPIIVTKIENSAISEPIEKMGAYGLLIKPSSVTSLVQGIVLLLQESNLEINKLKCKENKNIVFEHYLIKKSADEILKVYNTVFNAKSTC